MNTSFSLKQKPKSCTDIQDELTTIKQLCAKHEKLCLSFNKWKSHVEQNDAQLQILNETATSLRFRHKMLTDMIAVKPTSPEVLEKLQKEIKAVEDQVDIWIRELSEINETRTHLDIEFIQLKSKLQRSMTNIEIAHLDFDTIEKNHRNIWKKFLYNTRQLSKSR
uniref:Nsp1_C domain-containing protein n=1 Tax=Parastrongyloides trichosuri TaxID=131310 RepID=A0A0N4Z2M3_PARTI